jgi:hypothetical protein
MASSGYGAWRHRMKLNPWYLAAIVPTALLLASEGQYAAQLGVLGMTLGIFFGTLSLRRPVEGDATSTNPGT